MVMLAHSGTDAGLTTVLQPAGSPAADWLGTCGKTQLALFVADSLWSSRGVDLLAWVTATSRASVLAGYSEAAAAVGAGQRGDAEKAATRFLGWLTRTSRPWLVVLDGVVDAADMAGLWPVAGSSGRVVVTVAGAPPDLPGVKALPVGAFSSREALSYLMGRLTADPDQRLGAIDLTEELACEPLALAQACSVIASSALSCRDYLDLFLRRRDVIARMAGGEPPAAAVTWTLSVEHAERLMRGGPAHYLLALAALLDGHHIPSTVFTTEAALEYLASGGLAGGSRREQARDGLVALARAGLLTIDPATAWPAVRLNPVLATAIRAAMPAPMLDQAVRAAADALLESWPDEEPAGWRGAALRSCAASLRRVAGDRLWVGGCHPLLVRAGRSLDGAHLTGLAVEYWRELVAIARRVLPPGHSDTVLAGEQLARAYLAAGRPADAVSWFRWAMTGRAQALGNDHPSTVASRVDLGHALLAAGEVGTAVSVLDGAARDSERVHGGDHAATLMARDRLANACRAAGRQGDAIRLYRRTLADRERVQGGHHPGTIATRQQLAGIYLAMGRHKDAITHYQRALADSESALGTDHPDTITARGNLASAYNAAGRLAPGLQLSEQTRADATRVWGPDHPGTLASGANLALAYYQAGRMTDAMTLLRDTAAHCERVLPPGDPLTHAVRESLQAISAD
jgi:tetratricopeptide (TPR) repeat protein